ncbi:hypothetical protein B0H12DRAFT_235336 [Mycena haematopus]|nr:hypothetical protein B0H12DRAFT_235336 [Mycena haematopus]
MLSSLEADRVRLLDLEARIMDLERSLSALRTEQFLVQERLDAYKYPVLTLPDKLTSEIFIHFLPIYPDRPPLIGLDSPTSLTHICRHWREVALATPTVWRAIKFADDLDVREQSRHICAWVRRSGSCPLSIEIDMENGFTTRPVFTEPLVMSSPRWEHFKLRVPTFFLPKLGGPMPMLRSLYLAVSIFDDVFAFYEVPQLRTVVLTSAGSEVTLPCLSLKYVGINRCIQILAQTLNLVQCDLALYYDNGLDDPALVGLTEPDLILAYLESLTLEDTTPWQTPVSLFFHSFIAPSLCRLKLEEVFLGEQPIPALEPFISRSGCRLQEVCITSIRGTTTDPGSYRLAFPSIPAFSFHRYSGDHDESE